MKVMTRAGPLMAAVAIWLGASLSASAAIHMDFTQAGVWTGETGPGSGSDVWLSAVLSQFDSDTVEVALTWGPTVEPSKASAKLLWFGLNVPDDKNASTLVVTDVPSPVAVYKSSFHSYDNHALADSDGNFDIVLFKDGGSEIPMNLTFYISGDWVTPALLSTYGSEQDNQKVDYGFIGGAHLGGDYFDPSLWVAPRVWDDTPIPEPSTMLAGALLLLPFGASTARMLRKNK